MTSPVDTTVKFMHSGMVGAQQGIAGAAGSLNNALQAFLVDGWDAIVPTSIVVASGVATVTFPSLHSAEQESVVLISGVDGGPTGFANLNGEQKITGKAGSTVTFAAPLVSNGTATASVALGMKMAACGWAKPFTGTNIAAYRAATGNRQFLRIIDTATQDTRAIGYENMTAVGTGTGLFPTTAQQSGGIYWRKSELASAALNPYYFFGDGRTLYICIASNNVSDPVNYDGVYIAGFGDLKSWRQISDPYATFLLGAPTAVWPAGLGNMAIAGATSMMVCPRLHTSSGTSQFLDMQTESGDTAVSGRGVQGPYPGITDSLFLSKPLVSVLKTTYGPRGEMVGIWHLPQTLNTGAMTKGDLIVGAGETAGRKLYVVPATDGMSTNAAGAFATLFDVTGPWQ